MCCLLRCGTVVSYFVFLSFVLDGFVFGCKFIKLVRCWFVVLSRAVSVSFVCVLCACVVWRMFCWFVII